MTVKRFFSFLLLNLIFLAIPRTAHTSRTPESCGRERYCLSCNDPYSCFERYEYSDDCRVGSLRDSERCTDDSPCCGSCEACHRLTPEECGYTRYYYNCQGQCTQVTWCPPNCQGCRVAAYNNCNANTPCHDGCPDCRAGNEGGDGGENPDVALEIARHTWGNPMYVNEEVCGEICLHSTSNSDIDVDFIDIDFHGVRTDRTNDDTSEDYVLAPDETRCWSENFCFTPREVGVLTLSIDVRIDPGNVTYRDVDSVDITVVNRPNRCVRTECHNGNVWCVHENGSYDHISENCGNDSEGECLNHRCNADDDTVICDRVDIDRFCVNNACDSREIARTITVDVCAEGEQCINAACVDVSCVRTECRNDDRWCVDANGNYSRMAWDCGDDEIGQLRNCRCDANGDVACDRTDVDHFCLENQCRQQSNERTVVEDDCLAALEVCQDGACANRCVFDCFDQCDGDTLVVRTCEGFVCEEQNRDDCNRFDRRDPVERYCRDNAVHGRQRVTNGSCGGVLNACQTSTSTEQLGVLDACADNCDGNVRVANRGCANGQCGAGQRTDCDTQDVLGDPVSYCVGNDRHQHRWFVDSSCGGGACNAAPGEWINENGLEDCAWGCNAQTGRCNPNPCQNVQCNASCDGDTRRYNGRCVVQNNASRCEYDSEDCNARDRNLGGRQQYCSPDNGAVWSHQPREDFSCGGGECVGQSTFVEWREETVCNDHCDGNVSVWGRACQNGACTQGNRSDCDAMDTDPVARNVCDGDMLMQYDVWTDYSCVQENGRCDVGIRRTSPLRPVEDCAAREQVREVVDEYCVDGVPARLKRVSRWECAESECAIGEVVELEQIEDPCMGNTICEDGLCIECESEWRCAAWGDCIGGFRRRACEDVAQCPQPERRPATTLDCINECVVNQMVWSEDEVVDAADVSVLVSHSAECRDSDARWIVCEDDFLHGDCERGALRDECLIEGILTFRAGELSAIPLRLHYQDDVWGNPEYYTCLSVGDTSYRSSNIRVRPAQEDLGDLVELLLANPIVAIPCEDLGDKVFSEDCVNRFVTLGETIEEFADVLVVNAVAAWQEYGPALEVWLIYACEACAGGGVGMIRVAWTVCGAAVAAIPDPTDLAVCAPAVVMSVGCGLVCGGVVGDAVGFVARRVSGIWHHAIESAIVQRVAHWRSRGWRYVPEYTRISPQGGRIAFQNAETGLYLDEFLVPRIQDGIPVLTPIEIRNLLLHYAGGKEFFTLVDDLAREGVILRHADDFSVRVQGIAVEIDGYDLLASHFIDDAAAFRRMLREGSESLSQRQMRLGDITPEIRLERIAKKVENGRVIERPDVLGVTDVTDNRIQLVVEETARFYGVTSATKLINFVLPHELAHAVQNRFITVMRRFGGGRYTLNTWDGRNKRVVGAVEYLNDRYALRHLGGEVRDEYIRNLREWVARKAVDNPPVEWGTWIKEWRNAGLLETQGKYQVLRIHDLALDLAEIYQEAGDLARSRDMLRIAETIRSSVEETLLEESRIVLMQNFDDLSLALRAHGDTYVEDVAAPEASEALHTILERYRYVEPIGGFAQPLEDEPSDEPEDPRELDERDAGEPDAEDPRNINRRDAGDDIDEDAGNEGVDVLTVGAPEVDDSDACTCWASPEIPGHRFPSVADCRERFPNDLRCDRLTEQVTCFGKRCANRNSGCDCSFGISSPKNIAPFTTVLFALLYFRRRIHRR